MKQKITKKSSRSIYLDCEWFMNSEIFIIGYCYDRKDSLTLLYDKGLSQKSVLKMLSNVDTIYFYGPDIAYIEKNFNINIRDHFNCVNLLPLFRFYAPRLKSYKLSHIEKLAGLKRSTMEYKSDIWKLVDDWNDPIKKNRCLRYNAEDVVNLRLSKKWFFQKYGLTKKHALAFCLK